STYSGSIAKSAPAAAARSSSSRATRRLSARLSRALSWQTATRTSGALFLPVRAPAADPVGGQVTRDDRRDDLFEDDLAGDQHAGDVGVAWHLVHHGEQHFLHDRAEATGPGAAQDGLVGDRLERVGGELKLHAVELEQSLVLPDERVSRLGGDLDLRVAVEAAHVGDHRQPADELRDQPELEHVFRHDLGEHVVVGRAVADRAQVGSEADPGLADPRLHDLVQAGERPTADEQHVGRVDLDELLVRVLPAALRRHVGDSALDDLEQGLLDALAGHVTGDRGVFRLPRDLVDLVDVDDAGLRAPDVVVGRLDQLEQDVFDVLAHISGLGERGRVGDGERHVEHPGERLGQVGLAAPGGADEHDVGLGQLDGLAGGAAGGLGLHAFVVVVDRHRESLLGLVLPDHVLVEEGADLHRLGELIELDVAGLGELLFDDLVAQVDALVADVDTRSCDEFLDLLL